MTWGWVNDDRVEILGWSVLLNGAFYNVFPAMFKDLLYVSYAEVMFEKKNICTKTIHVI